MVQQFFFGAEDAPTIIPVVHPFGRRPFGPVQAPPGGTDFPFTNPSEDVQYLLGDLQLYYVDDEDVFEPPFSVQTLWGFEIGNAHDITASGNAFDILIVDANEAVVFDSREDAEMSQRDWFSRADVICWKKADATCKVIRHYAWSQGDLDAGLRVVYPSTLSPVNGELHPTCVVRQPPNLRSITVEGDTITDEEVHLVAGYNTEFTLERDQTGRDGRRADIVTMTMSPGLGDGRVPGCSDSEEGDDLLQLENAKADSRGAVYIEGDGCISVGRVEEVQIGDYRYPTVQDEFTLAFYNRCSNPCDADTYKRTYEGARRVFARWKAVADRLVALRADMQALIELWERERCCRPPVTVYMGLMPQGLCKIAGGIVICNATDCVIENPRITLALETTDYTGDGPVSCQFFEDTGLKGEYETAAPDTPFPAMSRVLPGFPSNVTRNVQVRVSLPGCIETTTVKAYVMISFVAPPGCDYPVVDPPPGVDPPPEPLRAWFETRVVEMKPTSDYCNDCE